VEVAEAAAAAAPLAQQEYPVVRSLHQHLVQSQQLWQLLLLLSHFMICHSKKCHRPRTSSCHKAQRGGTEHGSSSASCMLLLFPVLLQLPLLPLQLVVSNGR